MPRPTIFNPILPPSQAQAAPGAKPPSPPRLSGSGWLALRGGRDSPLGPGGQLGGSQAGMRLRYELGQSRQVALSTRVATPLKGRGAEMGLGVEWRPRGSPVALLAEQRIGIDGTPGGPSLMAIGGLSPTPIGGGFRLEGYGQGGAVLRSGRAEPFVDGAVRLAAPIATAGDSEVTLGGGAWGGAQRDAARLDVGPSLAVTTPIAGRNLRISLDWRHRIAGDARPGSGLALTVGGDF